MQGDMTRRGALGMLAATAGAAVTSRRAGAEDASAAAPKLKGRLKQAVCKWCYKDMTLEQLCEAALEIGLQGIDLLDEPDWAVVQRYGLTCPMASGPGGINQGWNDPALHDELVAKAETQLRKIADAGLPNMIVFSGNRRGMPGDVGLKNCVAGLRRITPLAEQLGVNVVMELLNSKKDHKDYMCDHTAWGVELVQQLESPRFKLLYDIYHMQIMEGDVIQTILDNIQHIAHFHTGGVPGRHEIDETQELFYPRICQAIVDTGFQGFLAQEFIPERDAVASLRQAALICDV